jgi:hypothetical protein
MFGNIGFDNKVPLASILGRKHNWQGGREVLNVISNYLITSVPVANNNCTH